MKIILFILSFFCLSFSPLSGIYDIQVQTLEGTNFSFGAAQGKKILIAEFNGTAPDNDFLLLLESIQKTSKTTKIIAVPATDFGSTIQTQNLVQLKTNLKLSFIITQPLAIKKDKGATQNSLFKWLTNVANGNGHFNEEVLNDNQMYFVSESGLMYALAGKGTQKNLVMELLNRTVN